MIREVKMEGAEVLALLALIVLAYVGYKFGA